MRSSPVQALCPMPPRGIEVLGISKRFGATQALDDVSLQARGGSIHAVTGENGAGKSTLMKLMAGLFMPDRGALRLNGQTLQLGSPAAAQAAGISTVFQELSVLPTLTVAENMMLGHEPRRFGLLDRRAMRARARSVLDRIGLALHEDTLATELSVAQQQMVEIAKGVSREAQVFIFDEPTAALEQAEVHKLGQLLQQLKAAGKVVFYISHRLDEIFRFCDEVTVLKDGRLVRTQSTASLTQNQLVSLMVGRTLSTLFPPRREKTAGHVATLALAVQQLITHAGAAPVQLRLRQGEIVGLAGLEGQGQRDVIRALAGLQPPVASQILRCARDGSSAVYDPGQGVAIAMAQGIALVPEDRKAEGLCLGLPVDDNVWLGLLHGRALAARAPRHAGLVQNLMQRLRLRGSVQGQPVASLSGGNQQKVLLGRWLAAGIDTLLIEQPTRGVDIGAKSEIYALLREFCAQGGAVLLTSSELPELIGLCDRLLVMRGGAIVGELPADGATEEAVLRLAMTNSTIHEVSGHDGVAVEAGA